MIYFKNLTVPGTYMIPTIEKQNIIEVNKMKEQQRLTVLTLGIMMAFLLSGNAVLFAGNQVGQYGKPDPKAGPEVAQFQFLTGDWTVKVQMRVENGALAMLKPHSHVFARYLPDGRTVQQEFSVPDGSFFSTQVKAYHVKEKRWINKFINSMRQRWTTTYSTWKDGKMVTIVPKGYSGKEKHWSKEIDSEFSTDRFVKRVYLSHDEGKTWEEKPMFVLEFLRDK